MTTKKKNTKGADAGTQFSHWTKNPHETPTTDDARKKKLPSGTKVRSTQASVNAATKKAIESYTQIAFDDLESLDIKPEKKELLRSFGAQLMTRTS